MSASVPAVGIDLGTTYSVIAHLDDAGRPKSLPNAEGELLTASVVLIDGYDVIVGKEAVKALASDAERIAVCAKRDMGLRAFHATLDGRQYPPEALQACVLHKLARDAARQIGPFDKAVVTVPAYFDEVRRKGTQDAGHMAGLEVLDIINEPTAAAVAYGCQQGCLHSDRAGDTKRILVYDLGGGTFDVTVMELAGTRFTALATDGDVQLGGRDWDMRLADRFANDFAAKHGLDPREDPLAAARLWRECEEAKRTLTTRSKALIACECAGRTGCVEISRGEFQELTQDLLDRTRFTVKQALAAAKLAWSELDHVLLVGGSSRMPAVRQLLREMSGREPEASVSPDEAVAHGAALHAGALLAEHAGHPPPFTIRNVNSHSLGVVAIDRRTGRKRNATLIPRNTPLPARVERVFKTQTQDQETVLVQIVEGENPSAENCTAIGQCIVHGLPSNLPAGSPVAVSFEYAANGRLAISVRIAGGPATVQEITRDNGLSPQHLAAWREWVLAERE